MSKPSLGGAVGRVRVLGRIEGVSFLLLLGVAMPLKYGAGMPVAVKVVGWAHGGLFVALMLAVLLAWIGRALDLKNAALVVVAALLPFGPFVIDRRLEGAERDG